jgi:hypothetical protein
MSGVFGPRKRGLSGLFAAILFAAMTPVSAAQDTFDVRVDQAQVMKLPDKVATIVVGNPLIADVTLQAGGLLVVTGKGYGSTNLLALDRTGRVIMDRTVQVMNPSAVDLVTVYKGIARESYSCAPECAARLTLGDSSQFFTDTMTQITARAGSAQGASAGGGAPH